MVIARVQGQGGKILIIPPPQLAPINQLNLVLLDQPIHPESIGASMALLDLQSYPDGSPGLAELPRWPYWSLHGSLELAKSPRWLYWSQHGFSGLAECQYGSVGASMDLLD